jgi:hypothetical protein
MSFKSFLSAAGHDFAKVFNWLGSTQGQSTVTALEGTAAVIGTAVGGPGLGAAISGVELLINSGLKQILSMEASAAAVGAQSGTGAQKTAAVSAVLAPQIHDLLVSLGVAEPTSEQVQTVATSLTTGLVAVLNALPVPAA